jgi:hypothetical protein
LFAIIANKSLIRLLTGGVALIAGSKHIVARVLAIVSIVCATVSTDPDGRTWQEALALPVQIEATT